MSDLSIVEYEDRHSNDFRDLNLSWIEEYFEIEDIDRKQLLDPRSSILNPGGAIFIAETSEGVAGVCALLYESPGQYELTKMAVRKDLRDQGVGRKLITEVISQAKNLGASKLSIISNTILEPAIHLYRAVGFTEVALPEGLEYARGNIAFELQLS